VLGWKKKGFYLREGDDTRIDGGNDFRGIGRLQEVAPLEG